MTMSAQVRDVIVVGGGPVGLTLALGLARRAVDVVVLGVSIVLHSSSDVPIAHWFERRTNEKGSTV
jgi:2-polyprenyl-6-methoxyphenol hydroxylase-like FAD-dependent oxidoreductase